ncbi:MAG: exopolyphosphatase, partial [Aeromicrobium sp.]|uniref:Ppx/GppA phosphatase family protein n=1 Tax=Aeromicrobium sp. TaxID=1871063 RepID=UPI002614A99A
MPEHPARVAAIDCGTNSIRLLISDIDADDKTDLLREMRIVRLGAGVDETGHLSRAAIDRTLSATREYAELIAMFGVTDVRFCATSAMRDADNGADLEDAVEEILGVRPVVLAGLDEARASFLGATRGLDQDRTLVLDIGGGSTEIVVGTGEEIEWSVSLDIGSVRLTERFLAGDPAPVNEVTACMDHLDKVLTPVVSQIRPVSAIVGVAGTVTTVAAHSLALPSYDSSVIHGARLALEDVSGACLSLVQMSVADRRALPFMHPGRADVI